MPETHPRNQQCLPSSKILYKGGRGFIYLLNSCQPIPTFPTKLLLSPTIFTLHTHRAPPPRPISIPSFCLTTPHHRFSAMLSKSFTGNPFCSQFLSSHPFLHVLNFTSVSFSASVIGKIDEKNAPSPPLDHI
jgi:hypothetical protein